MLGVDLLIDAVGFLLAWNGLRALQKQEPVFCFAPLCCRVLIPLSALDLFFSGWLYGVVVLLRIVLEALLYWQFLRGCLRHSAFRPYAWNRPFVITCLVLLLVGCAGQAFAVVGNLFTAWQMVFAPWLVWPGRLALLAYLAFMATREEADF